MLSDLKKRWKAYLLKKKREVPPPPSTDKSPDPLLTPKTAKRVTTCTPTAEAPKTRPGLAGRHRGGPPKKKQKPSPANRSLDKHGLPRIQSNEDLNHLFDQRIHTESDPVRQKISPKKRTPNKTADAATATKNGRFGRDKNDIPIISEGFDLYDAFTSGKATSPPCRKPIAKKSSFRSQTTEEWFADMVDESLSSKDLTTLLKEKDSLYQHGNATPVNEKIKRYPSPEIELDLHGYTGAEARKKTDSFVQNALNTGKLTLKIIVGKGIHSEGGAVLPDVVEAELVELQQKKQVLAFRWENHKKSKSGALIVYLV